MHDPGDRINRFTLEERLGSGGFAVVWRARTDRGDEVALKVPNYEGTNDRAEIDKRLRREVDVLRRVESLGGHPNVVTLRDAALDGPHRFLATELLSGEHLEAAFESGRLRPGSEAFETVAPGVCDALSFLHDHDLCYLDLKPQNVIVDDEPVLVDFNTAARGFADTLFRDDPFKPPELTPDSEADFDFDALAGPWSDVYALGKLFTYLLTGPDCDSASTAPGFDPRTAGIECGEDVGAAVVRATDADPRRRQQNATEVLVRLFADGERDSGDGDGPRARIESVETGRTFEVAPGDVLGRADGEATPDIPVRDPDRYVSPSHLRFDRYRGAWFVTDTSTNGTYLRRDGPWIALRCREGLEKRDRGSVAPERRPVAARRVARGDRLALVDIEYPARFDFYGE